MLTGPPSPHWSGTPEPKARKIEFINEQINRNRPIGTALQSVLACRLS